MKLLLTPPKNPYDSNLGRLFGTWLNLNGIFLGEPGKDFTVEYNEVYHFYEVILYPLEGNGVPTAHWGETVGWFEREGYQVKTTPWSRLDKQVQRLEGLRVWVYAKTFQAEDLKVRVEPEVLGDWSRAMYAADPQTDIVYLHVPRSERRPGYVGDTQWHLAFRPDSACNSKQEGRQRAEQVARHIIEAVRNY